MKYPHPIFVYQTGSIKGLPYEIFDWYDRSKCYYVKVTVRDETLYFGKPSEDGTHVTPFLKESEACELANRLKVQLPKMKIKYRDIIVFGTTKLLTELD